MGGEEVSDGGGGEVEDLGRGGGAGCGYGGGYGVDGGCGVVVGFDEEAIGGDGACGVGVEARAERDEQAAVEQLACGGGSKAEAVDDPGGSGAMGGAEVQDDVEGSDAVDNKGFSELFAEADVGLEGLDLKFDLRASEAVYACFADSYDGRI